MKRSTSTQTGVCSRFRCRKTVFFALGFIAAVLVFTVPVTAQDEGFPWAKKVDIDSPSMLEILNNAQKGGPLPNWAQTRYDSKDVKTLSLITKYASFLQLFKRHIDGNLLPAAERHQIGELATADAPRFDSPLTQG